MTSHSMGGLPPTHPGEVLREDILPELQQSKAELARMLGVSRQTLYDLLQERQAVSAEMALRLGKLLGVAPEFWLNMQRIYDLRRAEAALAGQLDAIPTIRAA